ncbi:MAG: glycosyltransferase family 4 protein [Acidimicrobiales bacterium]
MAGTAVNCSKRRLLVVSPTALMSGAETVLLRLVGAAIEAGWLVDAACPPGALARELEAAGAECSAIPDLKLPAGPLGLALGRLAWRTAIAARHLRATSRRSEMAVVNSIFALPALRIAGTGRPVVWLVHDVLRRRSWFAMLHAGRAVVTLAVAVSEAVAAPLSAQGLAVEVVRNGTPWPVVPVGDEPPSPPVIGCVALLTPWKGQHVVLEAASMLPAEVTVELVGGCFPKDTPYAESLRRRAAQPDLRGRVTFVGHVDDILARMRTWNVAVSPSIEPEAGPLAPLEAMSVGLPLVGTDHGGTSEVVGDAGLLVAPSDVCAMADALSKLLSDRELWSRCHNAGPRQIADGLTLDRQLRDLLDVIAGLADVSPARPRRPTFDPRGAREERR